MSEQPKTYQTDTEEWKKQWIAFLSKPSTQKNLWETLYQDTQTRTLINSGRRSGRTWKPLPEYRTVDYMTSPSILKHWDTVPVITRVLMAEKNQKPSRMWRIKYRIRRWWRNLITNT